MPLTLSLLYDQGVQIGDDIIVRVVRDKENPRRTRLTIAAPKSVQIRRLERQRRKPQERRHP